jgi:hypothetical protein
MTSGWHILNYFAPFPSESVARSKKLHRKDAKDAKKRKIKEKKDFIVKNNILPLAFVFLCVLRVFAVQGFLILQHSPSGEGRGEVLIPLLSRKIAMPASSAP